MSVTIRDLRAFKERGERFVMLTAYDYPTARILDEAGIPVILVGDSVGNNVLGYETTIPVTMQEMLHHTRAVVRGATNALVVGDMPFMSFHTAIEDAIANAGRFLKEGGAHAIKLEGGGYELPDGTIISMMISFGAAHADGLERLEQVSEAMVKSVRLAP